MKVYESDHAQIIANVYADSSSAPLVETEKNFLKITSKAMNRDIPINRNPHAIADQEDIFSSFPTSLILWTPW